MRNSTEHRFSKKKRRRVLMVKEKKRKDKNRVKRENKKTRGIQSRRTFPWCFEEGKKNKKPSRPNAIHYVRKREVEEPKKKETTSKRLRDAPSN